MALTITTPYARCEVVSQANSTTVEVDTVTGETDLTKWVGRIFYVMTVGTRDGQWRRITSVDTANSRITMEYAWRQTTSDPLIAATGGSQTATDSPAYETSLVANDVLYISYLWGDLADGVNLIETNDHYECVDEVNLGSCVVHSYNESVLSYTPAGEKQTTYFKLTAGGRYVQGLLTESGYGAAGGSLEFDTTSNVAGRTNSWNVIGTEIKVNLNGVNISMNGESVILGRFYDNTRASATLIDCSQHGNVTARYSGTGFILRHRAFDYGTFNGPVSYQAPYGGTFGFIASDSYQAVFHNGSLGAANADGLVAKNLSDYIGLIYLAGNSSRLTLSNFDYDGSAPNGFNMGQTSGYPVLLTNSLKVTIKNNNILSADGRLRIEDVAGVEVYNDTTSDGYFNDIPDLEREYVSSSQQFIGGSGALAKTPHAWHYRRYGVIQQSGSHTADEPYATLLLPEVDDDFITLSEAAAAALTGISVDFSTGSIVVSSSHDTSELYDYTRYQAAQSSNMQYDDTLVGSSALLDMIDYDLSVTAGTLSVCASCNGIGTDGAITVSSGAVISAPLSVRGTATIPTPAVLTGELTLTGTLTIQGHSTDCLAGTVGSAADIVISGATAGDEFDFTGLDFQTTSVIENTSGANIVALIGQDSALPTKLETSGTIELKQVFNPTTWTNEDLADGTTVLVRNITTSTTIDYATVSGGTGYTISMAAGTDYTAGDIIEVRQSRQSGTAYYIPQTSTITTTLGGGAFIEAGALAADAVLNAIGLTGSDYDAKFELDYVDDELDIETAGTWQVGELMTWWEYQMTLQTPMEEFWGAWEVMEDGSFRNDTSILSSYIDTTETGDSVESTGRRIHRSDGARPIKSPTTGGGTVDLSWRDPVTVVATGGSGLTASESSQLSYIEAVKNLVEADEVHTATTVTKLTRGTSTALLTKNHTGTPLVDLSVTE